MATEGQPQAPSAFGRYTLLERLAVGGMAEVFRAKITSSHGFEKILVIKRILPHLAADPNFVAMFIDEAKLTAQLTHPKIVQVLDFGEVRGQYFIALEYVDGFDVLALLRVARAEARAHPAHARGVHRQRGARRARLRAQRARHGRQAAADRPSRHLAVERLHLEARRREARRLRHRARAAPRIEDAGRHAQGQVRLHVARAGGRAADRRAQRSVRGRRRARRDADGAPAVLRAHRSRRAADGARREARSPRQVRRRPAARRWTASCGRRCGRTRASASRPRRSSATSCRTTCSRSGSASARAICARSSESSSTPSPEAAARLLAGGAPHGDAEGGGQGRGAAGRDGGARARPLNPDAARRRPARPQAPHRFRRRRRWRPTSSPTRPPPRRPTAPSQGSWPDDEVSDRSSAPGFTPVSRPGDTGTVGCRPRARAAVRGRPPTATSGGSSRRRRSGPPDSAGDISVITPMRLFCDLAVAGETGLLHFELGGTREGDLPGRRLARVGQLEQRQRALRRVPGRQARARAARIWSWRSACCRTTTASWATRWSRSGCCGRSTCSGCCREQVRDRVIDVFAWTEGTFAYYRGVTNRQENFPLGLDTFEILGAGVVNLPYELLDPALRPAARLSTGRDAARAAWSRRPSASARRRARC